MIFHCGVSFDEQINEPIPGDKYSHLVTGLQDQKKSSQELTNYTICKGRK